jgi:hypothetical protein
VLQVKQQNPVVTRTVEHHEDAAIQRMRDAFAQYANKFGDAGAAQDLGHQLQGVFGQIDDELSQKVQSAYQAARAQGEAGKAAFGTVQDIGNAIFNDESTKAMPPAIRRSISNTLKAYAGDDMNLNTLENLRRSLRDNLMGDATQQLYGSRAINQLDSHIDSALSSVGENSAYAPAREAFKNRLAFRNATDAFLAQDKAGYQKTNLDTVFNTLVKNPSRTDDLKRFTDVLKSAAAQAGSQNSPEYASQAQQALDNMRALYVNEIKGDGTTPTRIMKMTLDNGRPNRTLQTLFDPEDASTIAGYGHVAKQYFTNNIVKSRINPSGSGITAADAIGFLGKIKGVPYLGPAVKGGQDFLQNQYYSGIHNYLMTGQMPDPLWQRAGIGLGNAGIKTQVPKVVIDRLRTPQQQENSNAL